MEGIYLTSNELEVLSSCSGIAVKAYLRLRARMDIRTGVVGLRSGMSYQALREWTEEFVEKGGGRTLMQPSMRNVRTAVEQLVRRGLLVRMRTENLVFKCPLADFGGVRSKRTRHVPDRAKTPEPGTEPDTEPDTYPTGTTVSNSKGYEVSNGGEPDTEPGTEPDTYPTGQKRPNPTNIGDGVNPSTPPSSSTRVEGVHPLRLVAEFGLSKKVKDPAPVDEERQRKATELAVAARKLGASLTPHNPHVQQWAAEGIGVDQVEQAVRIALERRAQEGSRQSIGAGYLDAIIRTPQTPKGPPWWSSPASMDAMARELGIAAARPGEELRDYKLRIETAIRQQRGRA